MHGINRFSVVALGLSAVIAAVAALVQAVGWEGMWVAVIAVCAAALGLLVALWKDVYVPWRHRRIEQERELRHATAVGIDLSRRGALTDVSVMNRGTHAVTEIEVLGIPCGGDADPNLAGPPFEAFDHAPESGVRHVMMPGGDLCFQIDRLSPERGYALGSYRLLEGAPPEMNFELRWHDHQDQLRKSVGVGHLELGYSSVSLAPR